MKKCFVFCHGFGFDNSYWKKLQPYFAYDDSIFLDLGYFGSEVLYQLQDKDAEIIGVSHSLGFTKLLSSNIKFSALIGLQGFIDFLGKDQILHKKREQDLLKMTNQFNADPKRALHSFYKQCGKVEKPKNLDKLNKNKLCKDLGILSRRMPIPNNYPILVIGAENDIIVPPELIYDNFPNNPNVTIHMEKTGQHCFMSIHSELIYQRIVSFINEDK